MGKTAYLVYKRKAHRETGPKLIEQMRVGKKFSYGEGKDSVLSQYCSIYSNASDIAVLFESYQQGGDITVGDVFYQVELNGAFSEDMGGGGISHADEVVVKQELGIGLIVILAGYEVKERGEFLGQPAGSLHKAVLLVAGFVMTFMQEWEAAKAARKQRAKRISNS